MSQPVCTTCPYCGVGCGVTAKVSRYRTARIEGDKAHPANFGRLCSKGSALGETVGLEGRLLAPRINGEEVDWDTALDAVADGLSQTIKEHGPDAVAFYVSGQLLTEDYYVANKLMKGFIGSGNIDTNSRLCMASTVAGHKRAFGADVVPGCYEDLEEADLIILVGSNTAWCHPVLYQRIMAARTTGKRLVVIDPRRTATCDEADLHLALKPGSDVRLMNGLFNHLLTAGRIDRDFVEQNTDGLANIMPALDEEEQSLAAVASDCGLKASDVKRFFDWFTETPKVVTLFSQGVNQSRNGTHKVNAIINCHLLTGRIGRPGMGPFSLTGQPNAMGGREVGGLANQLAAHMDFTPAAIERVGRFWGARRMAQRPGLKAVDMFEAVHDGRIKAIWIMGTNPAVSLPNAGRVREALKKCPLVIVSDCMDDTDTGRLANILLPAKAWGEKNGTVTNSERRISRQRSFLPVPGAARADWRILCAVAAKLGHADAFPYRNAAEVFREHAALSGFENDGSRAFDIAGLAELSDADYEALTPIQWPVPRGRKFGTKRLPRSRYYGERRHAAITEAHDAKPLLLDKHYPLRLNTGRIRDQWHTMTRSGLSPRLMRHIPEPFVDVNPEDAIKQGLKDGRLAQVESPRGTAILRVRVSDRQAKGTLFAPIHWSDENAGAALTGSLIASLTDPLSGQPAFKDTSVSIAPLMPAWTGILVSRDRTLGGTLRETGVDYWARLPIDGGYAFELAGLDIASAHDLAAALASRTEAAELIDFHDEARQRHRWAWIGAEGLAHCLLTAPPGELPARGAFTSLLNEQYDDVNKRIMLLSGCTNGPKSDNGPIVCSCFDVGLNRILAAVADGSARSVEEIGALLQAGTNCGSCRPELKSILESAREEVAA